MWIMLNPILAAEVGVAKLEGMTTIILTILKTLSIAPEM